MNGISSSNCPLSYTKNIDLMASFALAHENRKMVLSLYIFSLMESVHVFRLVTNKDLVNF